MISTGRGASKIQRANLDGSSVQDLITTGLRDPMGIALDVAGGKMYWTDWGTVRSSGPTWTAAACRTWSPPASTPRWASPSMSRAARCTGRTQHIKIQRANLDGSSVEDLVTTGLSNPRASPWMSRAARCTGRTGARKDPARQPGRQRRGGPGRHRPQQPGGHRPRCRGRQNVLGGLTAHKIQRANLDGSGVQDLVTAGLGSPTGHRAGCRGRQDVLDGLGTQKIQRANLDGSGEQDLVTTGLNTPAGIALDVAGGKMYWTTGAPEDPAGEPGRQRRAGPGHRPRQAAGHCPRCRGRQDVLDGLARQDPAGQPGRQRRAGPGHRPIRPGASPWMSRAARCTGRTGTAKIQRANLDGSGVQDLSPPASATRRASPWMSRAARCTGRTGARTRSSGPTWTAAACRTWSPPASASRGALP